MNEIRESITRYLRTTHSNNFAYGGMIEKEVGRMVGTKPSCVARRLREMAEEGLLARRLVNEPRRKKMVVQYATFELRGRGVGSRALVSNQGRKKQPLYP